MTEHAILIITGEGMLTERGHGGLLSMWRCACGETSAHGFYSAWEARAAGDGHCAQARALESALQKGLA